VQIADQSTTIDTQFLVSTTYTDPGQADTHTVDVNWGDSTIESNIPISGGVISLSHTYTVPDIYTVDISVYDDDGASASTMFQVTVEQPASDPVMILPELTVTDGMRLNWEAREGYHYEIWFTDSMLVPFDETHSGWSIVDVVTGNSYNDIGDSDGYDNTADTDDDRLHPSQVTARFYGIFEIAD